MSYAWDKDWKIGRLELYSTWFEQMKGINAVENANAKQPYDVFSDAKNGCPVVIDKTVTKTTNRTKTDYAITQLQLDKNTRESWDEFFAKYAINETRIEDLKQVKTLESLYWESYTLEHFGRVKKALMHFDAVNKYDLFKAPTFSVMWERLENHIREMIPETEEPTNVKESLSITTMLEKPYEELTSDQVLSVLEAYIQQKYGQDQTLPKLSVTELKIWYKIAQRGENLPLTNSENDDMNDDLPF